MTLCPYCQEPLDLTPHFDDLRAVGHDDATFDKECDVCHSVSTVSIVVEWKSTAERKPCPSSK